MNTREESERRLLEQRLWQCQNRDKCTKENLPNIPNVKRDIRVATKMREHYKHIRRCVLLDDLRRGAIRPEWIGL